MNAACTPCPVKEILPWRDGYRQAMNCQIIHDSLCRREGWTEAYRFTLDGAMAGYALVAVAGPWTGQPTVVEFHPSVSCQNAAFTLFELLLQTSRAVKIETQTNDPLLTVMLHSYAREIESEKIIFRDGITTHHELPGATLRRATREDAAPLFPQGLEPDHDWLLIHDGDIVAKGGILYHYNRPYGDIYMEVAESRRRRGFGSFLVQELKRLCYEGGSVPAARCNPTNLASRQTLQKAGFVPCGHILFGKV